MDSVTISISILLSLFSTVVMSYISMATPIGPWIAPTLVLIGALFYKLCVQSVRTERLSLAVISGSIGGILATALGFSFPTLYFVDQTLFNSWMAHPLYFITVVGGLSMIAGWFGIWLANISEQQLIVTQQLSFPIGQLVYKMITAITQKLRKAYELMAGFFATTLFCLLQGGMGMIQPLIPQSIKVFDSQCIGFFRVPLVRFDLVPFVWAVGFLTGHVIAVPLLVGAVSRIIILDPLNSVSFFAHLSSVEFVLAFCSGLVLIGTITSFIGLPKQLYQGIKKWLSHTNHVTLSNLGIRTADLIELAVLVVAYSAFFSYFQFSLLALLFIFVATAVCAYQMAAIAGKIGMALLGRFATFVMIPGILLFGFTVVQAVLVATFVEVCGGVMTDVLFGRVVGRDAAIPAAKSRAYQYLGLVIAAVVVGAVFWILIHQFQLGSQQLFAQKAQARQLLLQARQFDPYVVLIGALFGLLLSQLKINAALVFGGLLMPINLVLGLAAGGLCASFFRHKEDYFPFWSGVFASQSIWMLFRGLMTF